MILLFLPFLGVPGALAVNGALEVDAFQITPPGPDHLAKWSQVQTKGAAVNAYFGDTREVPFYPLENLLEVIRKHPKASRIRMKWEYWVTGDYIVTYDRRKRSLTFYDSGRGSLSDGPSVESYYRYTGVTDAALRKAATLKPHFSERWVIVRRGHPGGGGNGDIVDDKSYLPYFDLLTTLGAKRHRLPWKILN